MDYLNTLMIYFETSPYILVLLAFILILFLIPIPEELILFTGGFLSAINGNYTWTLTLIVGIFGVFFTDYWFFILAKIFGQNFLKKKIIQKLFSLKKQKKAFHLVEKYGALAVFLARFIPGGIRNPVFFVCGLSKIKSSKFIFASLTGATISSQISFWLGYFLHDTIKSPELFFENIETKIQFTIAFIALIIIIYFLINLIRRNRRNKNNSMT